MKKEYGFTLIELMLVVIIISALAAMILPRLAGRTEQARISIAKADINANMPTALDLYELDNGSYPTTEQGLNALLTKPTSSASLNWNGPYLKREPKDPWGKLYQYRFPGTHNDKKDYELFSFGPDGVESNDDVTNWQE